MGPAGDRARPHGPEPGLRIQRRRDRVEARLLPGGPLRRRPRRVDVRAHDHRARLPAVPVPDRPVAVPSLASGPDRRSGGRRHHDRRGRPEPGEVRRPRSGRYVVPDREPRRDRSVRALDLRRARGDRAHRRRGRGRGVRVARRPVQIPPGPTSVIRSSGWRSRPRWRSPVRGSRSAR